MSNLELIDSCILHAQTGNLQVMTAGLLNHIESLKIRTKSILFTVFCNRMTSVKRTAAVLKEFHLL